MSVDHVSCTGCGGCLSVCPHDCISMIKSKEGFYTAFVNVEKCVQCGKCNAVCSAQRVYNAEQKPLAFFAAYSKDEDVRKQSASGGVFSSLAEQILKMGGVVYGAAFSTDFELRHVRVSAVKDIQRIRGSKYLQSDAFSSYEPIREDIRNGKTVLFSGTPCQVYGLKHYLGYDPYNLVTVDLICHGVPSPDLFVGYLKFLEQRMHARIEHFFFRSKDCPNDTISYTVKLAVRKGKREKIIIKSGDEEPYTLRYIAGALQNECCFTCNFSNLDRVGDISLGDYWGYEEEHPEIKSVRGVSLVLTNTNKGLALLQNNDSLTLIHSSEDKARAKNNHLYKPTQKHSDRDGIYRAFQSKGFSTVFYYSFFLPKRYISYILKRRIRGILN